MDNISVDAAMDANKANWDSRVPVHTGPGGYRLERFSDNPDALTEVVAFDIERLGDLRGLDVVHLQCHIGTDTLSLARLGAGSITGLDFSPAAIEVARNLAESCGQPARFIEANVFDARNALGTTYDLVYTGIGALNWLPDIKAWAQVVAGLLRPGGRLHLFEGHPMLYTLDDDATPEALQLRWPYFELTDPMQWDYEETYAGTGKVASPRHYEWAHGIGEVVQAVIDAGLTITSLEEHRVLPWKGWPWFELVEGTDDMWQMPGQLRDVIPMTYTLGAVRN